MNKAYDRVEWNFVEGVMKRMGFDPGWVDSIMKCVFTVSYSVVFNGNIGEIFHPTRSLRQGDPLSPFLFLFCGEGLSSLMRLAIEGKILKGVKAS
ncbi:LINE-1 retrotransposable element ORF2 protein [Gossypium australe]|uniref:LINE-1 retrotransposable element ORF2 protein n=1 Tax=Gossypium australe TaxID=47621 RepID=A0A5B6UZT1_9ROSI|nr:LINE-1 retrotransposable element ORF2 protein [Gossypium australe]